MKNPTQDPFVQAGEIHTSCLEDNSSREHSAREAHGPEHEHSDQQTTGTSAPISLPTITYTELKKRVYSHRCISAACAA
jgi:hypothetical protein